VPDANAAMQNNTSIIVLKQQEESTCMVEKRTQTYTESTARHKNGYFAKIFWWPIVFTSTSFKNALCHGRCTK